MPMDVTITVERSYLHRVRERVYSLAGKGMMSLASQGITSANNFATGILMGRLCPKEEYGLYALGLSLLLLVNDFQLTLISTPYGVYSPRLQPAERRWYAGSTFVHQMVFSAAAAFLLLCGLIAVYVGVAPQKFGRVIEVLAAVVVFILLKDFIRQTCFAAMNVRGALLLDGATALIQVGCLSLLAYRGALSAERTFLVAGTACGLASAGWLLSNRRLFTIEMKRVLPDLRQKWPLVKWILASQILWISAMSLYPWFIAAFLGVRANALWAACQSAIVAGNLISVAAQNLLGPKLVHVLAREGVAEMRGTVLRSTRLLLVIMSLLSLLFALFGNSLVTLMYGKAYEGHGVVVAILAINLAVSALTFPFSRGLFALERADLDFRINVAVVLSLLPGIWLVRTFGLPGAALGLLAANSVSVILRGFAFNRLASDRGAAAA